VASERQGGSAQETYGILQQGRQDIINTAIALGAGAEEAEEMADRLLSIPKSVTTRITVERREFTIRQQDRAFGARRDQFLADGGWAGAKRFPTGGWARGPGGPRDDRIPAWLSNGEFVVNAGAANQFGPLLEAINSGRMGGGNYGVQVDTLNVNTNSGRVHENVVNALAEQAFRQGVVR
jgi:hypothetical protein